MLFLGAFIIVIDWIKHEIELKLCLIEGNKDLVFEIFAFELYKSVKIETKIFSVWLQDLKNIDPNEK